ncbi:MAG: class I SAM-dependent methyltransferase [Desulfobacterales bacterium]|jgi:ubiquinone/menaquinone biosynthesis C-methylase UbiE
MDSYAKSLYLSFFLRESIMRAAIHALRLPAGSQGLDVGCGIGDITSLLAQSVAPGGHVTGVDISSEVLIYARQAAEKSGLSKQLSYREGDMSALPFDDHAFDWVWSADCVGYAPMEPLPLIKELVRVVKPGGCIAILTWSSQQLLPGYPVLEARLNATAAGIAPFTKGKSPNKHFLRALGWFRQIGLEASNAQTFIGDVHSPLNEDTRQALISLMRMRWSGAQSELTGEEWAQFQRLCQPESPDFILDRPDYYAFFTYSLFSGKIPEN